MSQIISTSIVAITPDKARELLDANTHNRSISRYRLTRLTEAIQRGEWVLNGEAIKFAADGTLLDGQHRLAAVIEAGQQIETLMITGLPNQTQETMDTGKSRSLADILTLRGVPNASSVAAITIGILGVERYGFSQGFIRSTTTPVTNGASLELLNREPEIIQIPAIVGVAAKNADLTHKVLGTLFYFFNKIDADDAAYFIDRLNDRVGLPENSPITALAKAAKQNKEAKGARNARYLAAITIKAWNAFREGRDVKILRFTVGGANPETFPEPR